jgi:hypothetical protein
MDKKTISSFIFVSIGLLLIIIPSVVQISNPGHMDSSFRTTILISGTLIAYVGLFGYLYTYLKRIRMRKIHKISKQIFFIFSSKDSVRVEKIYSLLKEHGYNPWIGSKDLLPGQIWKKTIEKVLVESEVVLVFLTTASINKKGYIQEELKLALDMLPERTEGLSPVIPIRLERVDITNNRLKEIQHLDLFDEEQNDLLLNTLNFYFSKKKK